MKSFFDTSVLITVFLGDHAHHDASLALFLKMDTSRGYCAAHSLAEVYSSITRLPGKHRISGEQTMLFLQEIHNRLTQVSLNEREYFRGIENASAAGIVGGAIYDALIAECALKAQADVLYTWNVKDFLRFGTAISRRVKTPA